MPRHELQLDAVDQFEHVALAALQVFEALDSLEVLDQLLVLLPATVFGRLVQSFDHWSHVKRHVCQPFLEVLLMQLRNVLQFLYFERLFK